MSALIGPDNAAAGLPEPQSASELRSPVALDPELQARLVTLETERIKKERWRTRLWRERRALLLLLGLVLVLYVNVGRARVVGHSMEPQFEDGRSLLILKTYRRLSPLRPGDIIVFHNPQEPTQELVKRVVFIQNAQGTREWPSTVQTSRGAIPVGELFTYEMMQGAAVAPSNPSARPPGGTVFVVGDNLDNSTDSRDFGPIRDETILGKVLFQKTP